LISGTQEFIKSKTKKERETGEGCLVLGRKQVFVKDDDDDDDDNDDDWVRIVGMAPYHWMYCCC
jgi:hypothetical protein